MTDIVKVKQDGTQVYPQTHANAVLGLSTIKGDKGDKGDTGATGPAGPAGQNATTTAIATSLANGLMAKEDKSKLDGIAAGAQKNPGNASTTVAGLMSPADKTKLDGLNNITFEKVGEV